MRAGLSSAGTELPTNLGPSRRLRNWNSEEFPSGALTQFFLQVVLVALRQARPRRADGVGRPGRPLAALRGATRRSATSSTWERVAATARALGYGAVVAWRVSSFTLASCKAAVANELLALTARNWSMRARRCCTCSAVSGRDVAK